MMRVLLTRPLNHQSQSRKRLEDEGHYVVSFPLLEVEPLASPSPDQIWEIDFDGILLTSGLAVPWLDENWSAARRDVTVLTTGMATRQSAQNAGFTNVISANGNALDLAEMAAKQFTTNSSLFYPCAKTTAHDLTEILAKDGLSCVSKPVYQTRGVNSFSDEIVKALTAKQIDVILLYSPASAKAFAKCYAEFTSRAENKHDLPRILALSEQVSRSLPTSMQSICISAKQPNEEALFELI